MNNTYVLCFTDYESANNWYDGVYEEVGNGNNAAGAERTDEQCEWESGVVSKVNTLALSTHTLTGYNWRCMIISSIIHMVPVYLHTYLFVWQPIIKGKTCQLEISHLNPTLHFGDWRCEVWNGYSQQANGVAEEDATIRVVMKVDVPRLAYKQLDIKGAAFNKPERILVEFREMWGEIHVYAGQCSFRNCIRVMNNLKHHYYKISTFCI